MLKLFGQIDRDFTSNGDKVIKPLRARVTKQDNGEFYLELETDLAYVNDLTEGRIILAPTPQGEQPFRVSNLQKTKNKLITKALHVFFDSRNYLIAQLEAVLQAKLQASNTITNTATGTNLAGDMEFDYCEYDPTNRYDKWLWLDLNNNYEQIGS